MRLILASASPRRRELLPMLGIPFKVVEPGVDELTEGEPRDLVVHNAELKAREGRRIAGADATVIGSDTDVELDGSVLGKPVDGGEAVARLQALAGRTHHVHSGVCVASPDGEATGAETTAVTFRELTAGEIDAYVATREWQGRAGGYAVQGFGSSLIARIDGDLSNVIGLPLPLTARLLSSE